MFFSIYSLRFHIENHIDNMPSKPIPLHRLGKNGPNIPAIGFGLMNMSYQAYGESLAGDEEKFALLDRAFELGETFWDTSELVLFPTIIYQRLCFVFWFANSVIQVSTAIMRRLWGNGLHALESAIRSSLRASLDSSKEVRHMKLIVLRSIVRRLVLRV